MKENSSVDPKALPFSAPADRNREPILEVLSQVLTKCETVLEIASGTGQHVVHFAAHMPRITWQPSEPIPNMRDAIGQRVQQSGLDNVMPPLDIDVCGSWPDLHVDGVIVANMLHISPQETIVGLCRGARSVCLPNGRLHIYGPFKQKGKHTAPSNEDFDASLRQRNPLWGIRDVEVVIEQAGACGWRLDEEIDMPANNKSLVFTAV